VKRLLLQFDTSPHPSSFDQVVAYDGGADRIMSYGGVTDASVRDLVHGAIFTRGPKDLHNTAIFIGGTDMAAGERLLATVQKTMFGPMRVSVLLDSNGSNTTAVAAVVKLQQAADVRGSQEHRQEKVRCLKRIPHLQRARRVGMAKVCSQLAFHTLRPVLIERTADFRLRPRDTVDRAHRAQGVVPARQFEKPGADR